MVDYRRPRLLSGPFFLTVALGIPGIYWGIPAGLRVVVWLGAIFTHLVANP